MKKSSTTLSFPKAAGTAAAAAPSSSLRHRHRHPITSTITRTTNITFPLVLSLLLLSILPPSIESKEIVATREWQLLGEDDTLPAGLHVRMDLTSGQKWARLNIDDDSDASSTELAIDVDVSGMTSGVRTIVPTESDANDDGDDGPVRITQLSSAQSRITPEQSSKITSQLLAQERARFHKNKLESIAALDDFKNAAEEVDDVEVMYRALASLPNEELERMGGLPVRPTSEADTESDGGREERQEFERAVRHTWETRQKELKKMEEEYMADAPDLLRARIESLEQYILSPLEHLQRKLLVDGGTATNEEDGDDGDIIWVLDDLDYQLMDIDMARDFHTMGGWPLLVSLLTDAVHGIAPRTMATNVTLGGLTDETVGGDLRRLVWKVQGLASSAIGSAVRNIEEFHPWALEDFGDALVHPTGNGGGTRPSTNVLSVLRSNLASCTADPAASSLPQAWQDDDLFGKKVYRELHALGALLRGNRPAIVYFIDWVDGGRSLSGIASSILAYHGHSGSPGTEGGGMMGVYTGRLVLRIATLAQDILMEVVDDSGEEVTEEKHMVIRSFTSEEWCAVPSMALGGVDYPVARMKEGMLELAVALAPYCRYNRGDFDRDSIFGAAAEGEPASEELEDAWVRLLQILPYPES